jgi:alpha-tubulin suppressor-like RCC1 family protein
MKWARGSLCAVIGTCGLLWGCGGQESAEGDAAVPWDTAIDARLDQDASPARDASHDASALQDATLPDAADGATSPVDAAAGHDAAADAVAPLDASSGGVVWTKVAADRVHACGLRADGTLWCWGDYTFGRLGHGIGGSSEPNPQPTPVQVRALGDASEEHWNDWVDVAAGRMHTCGIRADGTLWCWGSPLFGRLGDGVFLSSEVSQPTPVQVVAAEGFPEEPWNDWVEMAGGAHHTCGRRRDGSLWCWGLRGFLGDGLDETHEYPVSANPVRVLAAGEEPGGEGWTDWVQVSSSGEHTCGRRANGTLWCWGNNVDGRIGNGTFTRALTPALVVAAEEAGDGAVWDDWGDVAAGVESSCGRRQNGSMWCWGSRAFGKLGDGLDGMGEEPLARATPTAVLQAGQAPGSAGWTDWHGISVGTDHACGRRAGGSAWCWGRGAFGRLGNASTAHRSTPSQVLQAGAEPGGEAWYDWTSVAAGAAHTCGLRSNASLWCWGNGERGQRGDGDAETTGRPTPIQVLEPAPAP